ncbi:MAG: AGE family epimerase/isomerase [Armatimonadota bacterium]|nr:AGE family epimerase/isomerase [bacterium]MDW8319767.1 AGE family epimerase/isomerase [Armatimonadota bacterium]
MSEPRLPSAQEIQAHVLRNLQFWAEHAVDREYGGFWTHLNRDGSRYGDGQKFLVMQARMTYAFAIACLWSGDSAWKELVEHGARFLQERMHDPKCGGWFWTVSREGEITNGSKMAYGHAFAVYALAYAGYALRSDTLLHDAEEGLHWMLEHLWDTDRGGYVQSLTRCLFPLDDTKRLDTQLHALEAASAVAAFCGSPFAREHLYELAQAVVTHTLHPNGRCAREWFLNDWSENIDATGGNVSIGHNLEAAWFLRVVGLQLHTEQFNHIADTLLRFCLQYGWDHGRKAFIQTATPGGKLVDRHIIYWTQGEALGALSLWWRLTAEAEYRERLAQVCHTVLTFFHDADYGDYFETLDENCQPTHTYKGSAWKAAYHLTQAWWHVAGNLYEHEARDVL